jgi:hypothetical protein
MTRSHLVPESIGGFIWARTMCKSCNEVTGHSIEAGVRKDDSVRFALDAVRNDLPELADGQQYFARTDGAIVNATLRDGNFVVRSSADGDTLTQSYDAARATVETRVRRRGATESEVRRILAQFDSAAVGVPVRLTDELVLRHGQVEAFALPFDGEPVSEAFPALIGFHTLALVIGRAVYGDELNGLQGAILAGEARSEWHSVQSLFSRKGYRPIHLVGIEQGEPYIIVQVRLFNALVWRVHFTRVAARIEPHALMLDLKTRELHAQVGDSASTGGP